MSHPRINTLVFDFGGVLIEWDPRFLYRRYFATPEEMEAFLLEINFAGWNAQQDRGRPFTEGVRELSARFPQYHDLIRLYHEHWIESIGAPISGTIEILRRVRSLGYGIYGLSNWSQETFPQIRQRYNFFNLLHGYLISGEARTVKPEPAIFIMLLERIKRQPQDCLFIDDSQTNIEAAARLGFHCITFEMPAQLETELIRMGIL